MGQVHMRPELMTPGGQAATLWMDDVYAGALTLVYRENDLLWGMVQLDEEMLSPDDKEEIDRFVHQYVEDMLKSLQARECMVTTTYSAYDHVITTENFIGEEADEEVALSVQLIREEDGALIFHIYDIREDKKFFIGEATADLSAEEVTVLADLKNPRDHSVREQIAYHLIDRLEEEAYFSTCTITMKYQDEVIDEYFFDYTDQETVGANSESWLNPS